jgi:hypothetical protein
VTAHLAREHESIDVSIDVATLLFREITERLATKSDINLDMDTARFFYGMTK